MRLWLYVELDASRSFIEMPSSAIRTPFGDILERLLLRLGRRLWICEPRSRTKSSDRDKAAALSEPVPRNSWPIQIANGGEDSGQLSELVKGCSIDLSCF